LGALGPGPPDPLDKTALQAALLTTALTREAGAAVTHVLRKQHSNVKKYGLISNAIIGYWNG